MGWFFADAPVPATSFRDSQQPAPPNNLAADLKPTTTADPKTDKPKPCCVCKDEKSARDECMLFSRADDPQEDCKNMVDKYRDCMKGFGFKIA